jgi:hypothetical protein
MSKTPPRLLSVDEVATTTSDATYKLPEWVTRGVGAITIAQAFLERQLFILLCDLLVIDQPEGRVTLRDQSANERMKFVKTMIALRRIKPTSVDVPNLIKLIDFCTTCRNQLAHGVWCPIEGKFQLQLVKESYDVEIGSEKAIINRAFTPQLAPVPDDYLDGSFRAIETAITEVAKLSKEVTSSPALLPLLQKRGLRAATA